MKILDMPCVKGFMQLAQDGTDKGWHEMNGGNLSYHLTAAEAKNVRTVCKKPQGDWVELGESVPKLSGEFFCVTRTTGYMRNVNRTPAQAFGIVELDKTGTKYRIWWGLSDGGRPTSEFPSHLRNHEVKYLQDNANRVIYHAHPVNLIAMTFIVPLKDRDFSRALWQIMTECPVIFPKGVGVVPWMVPGKGEIADATSKLMEKYDIVVWAHHGLFCAGTTFDRAFGLMDTVEKSADIYMRVAASGQKRLSSISDNGIRKIIKAFDLQDFNTKFLNK